MIKLNNGLLAVCAARRMAAQRHSCWMCVCVSRTFSKTLVAVPAQLCKAVVQRSVAAVLVLCHQDVLGRGKPLLELLRLRRRVVALRVYHH